MAARKGPLGMPIPSAGGPAEPAAQKKGALGRAEPAAGGLGGDEGLELVCEKGGQPGRCYPIGQDRTRIGRKDEVERIAPEIDLEGQEDGQTPRSVSRVHAEIASWPEGYEIVDLKSTNGTRVNGVRLEAGKPQPLREGDRLTIGRIEFVVRKAGGG